MTAMELVLAQVGGLTLPVHRRRGVYAPMATDDGYAIVLDMARLVAVAPTRTDFAWEEE